MSMKTESPILVVEAEPVIQDLLEDALHEAGFAVARASSAQQGIRMLDAPHARYCALITDVDPKAALAGWDVARHARRLVPGLPVVYASSRMHEWEQRGVPGSVLVKKPYALAEIVDAVSRLLNAKPRG